MTYWTQTFTGRAVDLLDPAPDSICLDDIAHALARICRYTGHVAADHYSVAQHCVLVSYACDPVDAFEGLMHDAPEAYVGDVAQPIKQAMRALAGGASAYDALEERIERAIARRFGLRYPHPASVKRADLVLLATEARDLMHEPPRPWGLPYPPLLDRVRPVPTDVAERMFRGRFAELTAARSAAFAEAT